MLSAAASAHAQPAPSPGGDADPAAQARRLYEQGTLHYDLREYDQAIAAYREAYRLAPRPALLFNIAQAYRLAGDCHSALTYYNTYLRYAPAAVERPQIEVWLIELAACSPAAPPTPDARAIPTETSPPPAPAPAPAPPIAPALPPAPPRERSSARLIGAVTGGVGAGALLLGGAFSLRAQAAASEVEEACRLRCDGAEIAAADRRGRSAERTASVLYIAGGALVVAGAGLITYALLHREAPVQVTPTAGGALVSTEVRF